MRHLTRYSWTALIVLAAFSLSVPAAEPVGAGSLKKMLNDTKWEMKWAACMGASPCRAYWDWKAD